MSLDEKSKLIAECIKDLYLKGKYEVEYAILKLEEYKDNGKITVSDYESYLSYLKEEKAKQDEKKEEVSAVEEIPEENADISNEEENNAENETEVEETEEDTQGE